MGRSTLVFPAICARVVSIQNIQDLEIGHVISKYTCMSAHDVHNPRFVPCSLPEQGRDSAHWKGKPCYLLVVTRAPWTTNNFLSKQRPAFELLSRMIVMISRDRGRFGTLHLFTAIRFETYDVCARMRGAGMIMKAIGSLRPSMKKAS